MRLPNTVDKVDTHPNLDQAAVHLQRAATYEVNNPENREHISLMLKLIQQIHGQELFIKDDGWIALREQAEKMTNLIQCQYCRNHTYHDLVESIDVARLYDQGLVWEATKLEMLKDIKKYLWMLRAGISKYLKV